MVFCTFNELVVHAYIHRYVMYFYIKSNSLSLRGYGYWAEFYCASSLERKYTDYQRVSLIVVVRKLLWKVIVRNLVALQVSVSRMYKTPDCEHFTDDLYLHHNFTITLFALSLLYGTVPNYIFCCLFVYSTHPVFNAHFSVYNNRCNHTL